MEFFLDSEAFGQDEQGFRVKRHPGNVLEKGGIVPPRGSVSGEPYFLHDLSIRIVSGLMSGTLKNLPQHFFGLNLLVASGALDSGRDFLHHGVSSQLLMIRLSFVSKIIHQTLMIREA